MYRWDTGPRRPEKKWPRWIWATLLLVYIYSFLTVFIPNAAAKSLEALRQNPAAGYEADTSIAVTMIIGSIAAILYGLWAKRMIRSRMAEEESRLERVRRFGGGVRI